MITRIINNEEEYLALIADAIEFGVHVPNQFVDSKDRDDAGLSICDKFVCFPARELYKTLGAYIDDEPLPDTLIREWEEDGGTYEEWSNHFHMWKSEYRDKLKLYPDNPYVSVPESHHYPIVVDWFWDDDFDRFGAVSTRSFQWWSIKELKEVSRDSLRETRELWESRYRDKLKK